jgi:hypothetical protein
VSKGDVRIAAKEPLFDHLVGAGERRWCDIERTITFKSPGSTPPE